MRKPAAPLSLGLWAAALLWLGASFPAGHAFGQTAEEPAPAPCPSPEAVAASFRPGEAFKYRASWSWFSHAGDMAIEVSLDRTHPKFFRIVTTVSTQGPIRWFHKIDNRVESLLLANPLRIHSTATVSAEGKRRGDDITTFDHEAGVARFTDRLRPEKSKTEPIDHPCLLDIMSGVLRVRGMPMEPGDVQAILVHSDGEKYLLTLHAEKVEKIKTPLGAFEALRVQPRMDFNPKGFFRRKGKLWIWYSLDERRLLLRIKTKLKIGAAVATLVEYTPPSSEEVDTGPPASP
ncbi:MAG: DUF3108 domain-containing protein [Acidobacteriota bacterium]|nr:MAG: DUF3108 domain-containing protein [Acidobacteriota bacterium]